MCRIIYGCINMDGEILSGSNGEDPALDFSVEKNERGFEVNYKTPFKAMPSLTLTPNYGGMGIGGPSVHSTLGHLLLTSNESNRFRLELVSEGVGIRPQNFSFIAIK